MISSFRQHTCAVSIFFFPDRKSWASITWPWPQGLLVQFPLSYHLIQRHWKPSQHCCVSKSLCFSWSFLRTVILGSWQVFYVILVYFFFCFVFVLIQIRVYFLLILALSIFWSMPFSFWNRVLVGTGRACFETLRPLAYSLLAEIVHHVRGDLSLSQVLLFLGIFKQHYSVFVILFPFDLWY